MDDKALENLILELKRGVTSLAVLLFLQDEQYGYSLQTSLAENGIVIEQGTLYPLLRRLESQGLAHIHLANGRCPSQDGIM